MTQYTLIIDTAFETCQVGLWQGATCITMAAVDGGGKHDIILAPLVDEIFKVHKVAIQDIAEIVVTTGPGRFTGLRVGIAFARGLALIHQTPLIGVSTTDALRLDVEKNFPDRKSFAVIASVKRGENFAQLPGMPIERVMDDDMASWLNTNAIDLVAGVISAEALEIIQTLKDVTHAKNVVEPTLEAIWAVSQGSDSQKSGPIRPYYAV